MTAFIANLGALNNLYILKLKTSYVLRTLTKDIGKNLTIAENMSINSSTSEVEGGSIGVGRKKRCETEDVNLCTLLTSQIGNLL